MHIIPTSIPLNQVPHYDITPKPAEDLEVRVCVFDTVGVKSADVEGTSDVYCRLFFDSAKESKETDCHYRCSNGKASFNYRLLFKAQHPMKDYTLTMQLYDRDFFKSNDMIGDAVLDLALPIEVVSLSKRPLGLTKTYYNDYMKDVCKLEFKDENTFWVPIRQKSEEGQVEQQGKLRIRIDIYPKA